MGSPGGPAGGVAGPRPTRHGRKAPTRPPAPLAGDRAPAPGAVTPARAAPPYGDGGPAPPWRDARLLGPSGRAEGGDAVLRAPHP
ncbi:hypothetical protein CP979_28535 [Streptomyces filamentosus]|nr:hypothetical protein CP979_28535 [Streptomyces filamentosus]